jgi:nucleoid-associated protein YgaU
MSSSTPSERGHARLRIATVSAAILGVCLCAANFAQAQDASQDVAEAARQARARKAAQAGSSQTSSHVYTNDDLQRSRILLESGDANADVSVAAQKKDAAPAVNSSTNANAGATAQASPGSDLQEASATESLGEVARRYRREKAAREAERASKLPSPSPFHMEVPQAALGEILPGRTAVMPSLPVNAPTGKPASRGARTETKSIVRGGTLKRDPFSRPANGAMGRRLELPAIAIAKASGIPRALPKTPTEKPAAPMARPQFAANPLAADAKPVASVAASKSGAVAKLALQPRTVTVPILRPTVTEPSSQKKKKIAETTTAAVAPKGALAVGTTLSRAARASESQNTFANAIAVHAGDSLWKLSRRYMGSGARWREWLSANPELGDPRRLATGSRLVVPQNLTGAASTESESASAGRASSVVVRAGDSLWKVAARRYGHGAYWHCVARSNSELPSNELIHPGLILALPEACGAPVSSSKTAVP